MTTQTTYTYDYNRVYLTIDASEDDQTNRPVAFLQDQEAHELADELENATDQQQQEILSHYDY